MFIENFQNSISRARFIGRYFNDHFSIVWKSGKDRRQTFEDSMLVALGVYFDQSNTLHLSLFN